MDGSPQTATANATQAQITLVREPPFGERNGPPGDPIPCGGEAPEARNKLARCGSAGKLRRKYPERRRCDTRLARFADRAKRYGIPNSNRKASNKSSLGWCLTLPPTTRLPFIFGCPHPSRSLGRVAGLAIHHAPPPPRTRLSALVARRVRRGAACCARGCQNIASA
jgi:hypothetical protein